MDKLFVNIIWHMHQPFYWNEEEHVFDLPWVRTHAVKDYLFMGKLLERFPQVRVTFNFVPSLLRQFELYLEGKEDRVMILAKKRASSLSEEEKKAIFENFFMVASPRVYAPWPRYQELKEKSSLGWHAFHEQDFLDLQILYQLIWFDPLTLEENIALRALHEKGRNYGEDDKELVWTVTRQIFRDIFVQYRKLVEHNQVELSFSPFYHPILPLLICTEIARLTDPSLPLPQVSFAFPHDARAQIRRGKEFVEGIWGRPLHGVWPSEGAVSEEALLLLAQEGVRWIATDEEILWKTLSRHVGNELYLPHRFRRGGNEIVLFFRDRRISDAIGFEYHHLSVDTALRDLWQRLERLKEQLLREPTETPYLVTIVLDGENAWEYYVNNGLQFLSGLYQGLSEDPDLVTILPSEYLARYTQLQEVHHLSPGSWIFGNFSTWIGHWEKNRAWEELGKVRSKFEELKDRIPQDVRMKIEEQLYQAEGSDWFWWLGEDHPSPQKGIFWDHFSGLVRRIAQTLEEVSTSKGEGTCTSTTS